MMDSQAKLAALPDATLVYCAHEYALSNLRSAETVESGNHAQARRLEAARQARDTNLPMAPATIAIEKAINRCLRYVEPVIGDSLVEAGRLPPGSGPVEGFAALHEWKKPF